MTDPAHYKLIADLEGLVTEAKAGNFHDTESKEYLAPKMALSNKLRIMRNDVLNGKYNNQNGKN